MNDVARCDVAVIGAGPVGLFLAAELRLAGVAPVVVERLAEPDPVKSDDDRGLSARTLHTLDLRGLAEPTTALSVAALRRLAGFADPPPADDAPPDDLSALLESLGMGRVKGDFAMLPLIDHDGELADIPAPLMVLQGEFEQLLADRVAQLGVPVLRGREVIDIAADGEQVTAVFADGGGLRAPWLVGCDGGRSPVRRSAGIDFPGTGPAMVARVAVADLTVLGEQVPRGLQRVPAGVFALSAPPAPSMTIEFDPEPFDRSAELAVDEFQASLRRVSGLEVTVDTFAQPMRITDNARQASTYRRDRVLLAGDAAHVHSPINGQGLDLGLQDAANLGWKLALVVRGLAGEELLDTYTAERHPVGARVLRNSRAETALLRTDPHTEALREVVSELMREPQAARHLLKTGSGVLIRYPASESAHPLVGSFVPDLALTTAGGTHRCAELLRTGRALLVDLTGSASLRAVADGWTDRITILTATSADRGDLTALLVRPDGYVAWAAGTTADLDELRSALTRWLGRTEPQRHERPAATFGVSGCTANAPEP